MLFVVFVVTFLSYVLLLTKNYYWDGIFFAYTIENAPRLNATLVHPSHLLDMVLNYVIYRAVLLTGLQPRALTVMQVTNCVFGAAAACVFFRICVESFKSNYVSLVATAVFAFSATWWKFATDANNYVLAVLLLLVCFYLILPSRTPRPFALALVHALAMFIHELSVLFFPVAVVGIMFQCRDQPRNVRLSWAAKYALTVVPITVMVYFSLFYLSTGSSSVRRFATWITYFSPEHGFTFSVWSNFVYSLRSQWRAFFGGRTGFVRDMWGPAILTLVVISGGLIVAFLVTLFRRLSELRASFASAIKRRGQFKKLTTLCLIWIAVYFVFLFFFIPQNTFYRLFYLPALILLAGCFLTMVETAPDHVRRYRAALFAAAMFFSNLTLGQFPYSQVRANPPLQLALEMNRNWPNGTAVYFAASNSDNLMVKYFNPATLWIEISPDELVRDFSGLPARGRSGWLETTLIDQFEATPEGKAWLQAHTITQPEYELVNRKYRIRFRRINAESFAQSDGTQQSRLP